jgi:hypothetical protein
VVAYGGVSPCAKSGIVCCTVPVASVSVRLAPIATGWVGEAVTVTEQDAPGARVVQVVDATLKFEALDPVIAGAFQVMGPEPKFVTVIAIPGDV